MRKPDQTDIHVEEQLRLSVPKCDQRFVADLEGRLFPSSPSSTRRVPTVLIGGSGAAISIAIAFLGFGLVGQGPVATHDDGDARAADKCRPARPARDVREPILTEGRHGRPEIRYRGTLNQRAFERCR